MKGLTSFPRASPARGKARLRLRRSITVSRSLRVRGVGGRPLSKFGCSKSGSKQREGGVRGLSEENWTLA